MLDRRAVELVLISLLAAFCGGLAWALDHELFCCGFCRNK
jgi:formate dehydrogenase assembly factor FdhD